MENEIIPNLWEKKERDHYAQKLSECLSLLDPERITSARQDCPEIFITTKGNTFDRPLEDIEFIRLSNKTS
jgi:hypothetical protein